MSAPRQTDLEDGGTLLLWDPWLPAKEATALLETLLTEVPWAQKPILLMGRHIMQPRLVAWMGDPDAVYTYSGVQNHPLPWSPAVASLRQRVEEAAGARFNSALLNLYRDGNDSMGFHADKERELGKNPIIASLSLGAARRFQLRHARKGGVRVDIDLGGGSLLIMAGTTQHHFRHGVPKQKAPIGPRVNLTFRRILPPSEYGAPVGPAPSPFSAC